MLGDIHFDGEISLISERSTENRLSLGAARLNCLLPSSEGDSKPMLGPTIEEAACCSFLSPSSKAVPLLHR